MPARKPDRAREPVARLERASLVTPDRYRPYSTGFTRQDLIDGREGSVHMGLAVCELGAGGWIGSHVHAFEESFYVLGGTTHLTMLGRTTELGANDCGLIPLGVPHRWSNEDGEPARLVEVTAPRARPDPAGVNDTVFLPIEVEGGPVAAPLDFRDPRTRHFARLDADAMDLRRLSAAVPADAPVASSSMTTALLVFSGIAVKMLVDETTGARLHTMFMVEVQPGGGAQPHDHPFEEAYLLLEGEVEFEVDGLVRQLRAGDVCWAGVGAVHAARNRGPERVRWLETQAPAPPIEHAYRFRRDWAYLAARAGTALDHGVPGAEGSQAVAGDRE